MERNIQKNGLVNLLVMLGVGVAGFAVARYSQSLAGQVSSLFVGLGVLVAAVSWFQMRLAEREQLEKFELEELARGHDRSALFEAREADLFPAQRSREQFDRFFVPIFTILLGLIEAGSAWLLWRWLAKSPAAAAVVASVKDPFLAMSMFGVFFLLLFILGKFAATIARLEDHRLLRPGAGLLMLCAYLSLAVAIGIAFVEGGFPRADFYVAAVLCGLLALVAAETLVVLVLEIYRPRVKGRVGRPLYESRLVGLLGQPESLITTAAHAVDYQFGFKVSETWVYRFLERAVLWLVPLQIAALLISTSFVIIQPGEQGLLERFGRQVEGRTLLEAGPHLTWPWPIDKVYRFRAEQIQSFNVGFAPDPAREREPVVLWTVAHTKEENFLIANRDARQQGAAAEAAGKRTPPVSLLTVSIPVQFQITNLVSWAYGNEDAAALLQNMATREVVRYLAGVNLDDLMSQGRGAASAELRDRVQAASDGRQLGARIISVGLQDLHPPVKVAPDYEKVLGAQQSRQAKILAAQAEAIRTNALAEAQATNRINRATADRRATEMRGLAQASLFTNQIPSYAAAPAVYAQRAYLLTFARATANARKYLWLATNTHDVIQFDLQESLAKDLLRDVTVPAPKSK